VAIAFLFESSNHVQFIAAPAAGVAFRQKLILTAAQNDIRF
jgi:hypothetical protein